MSALKLCILASEMMPFAKTGGLADVVGALARQLADCGHEVRAFVPFYSLIRMNYPQAAVIPQMRSLALMIGADRFEYAIRILPGTGLNLTVYFVDCPAMFERAALYTFDADEHRRFLLFTRAVIESCQHLRYSPDIFHCNDWHTAFAPLYLKTVYSWDRLFVDSKSVLTIHNIGYQGQFAAGALADLNLGFSIDRLHQDDLRGGVINSLKTGIMFADAVTTVSPTYAHEICSTSLGMGMQDVLTQRAQPVVGILNGVDYDEWDPQADPYLSVHYHRLDLRGKLTNKRRLLDLCQLSVAPSMPLISMVTRFAEQKGIDLLFDSLPQLIERREFAFVVLGGGESRYERFFRELALRFPQRVVLRSGYDESLAHLIEAGSDMFLMPSRYEPCGLNQMYSLRFGTVPIVRRTGGLADSVRPFDPITGLGTGVVFEHFDPPAVNWAVNTALDWFTDRRLWRKLMRNGMAQDFSWAQQIIQYEGLYRELVATSAVS